MHEYMEKYCRCWSAGVLECWRLRGSKCQKSGLKSDEELHGVNRQHEI
jgi:hypothetical protein